MRALVNHGPHGHARAFMTGRNVETEAPVACSAGAGSRFLITWSPPSHRRTLPSFAGVLEVVPDGEDALLRIRGSYEPPLGAPGKVLDAVAGRRVARASIQDLTNYIAARLGECAEERESAVDWRPPVPPESIRDRPPPEAWLG